MDMIDSAKTLRAAPWLTAFEAALGWMKHGERIFLDTLAAGWAMCF